jgi:hypothetical protein
MEGCYLHQLPRTLIRALAGWDKDGKSYFLPRSFEPVPENLRRQVFPWLEEAKTNHSSGFECIILGDNDMAGENFIELLGILSDVLIQDSVLMKKYNHVSEMMGIQILFSFSQISFI